MRYTNYMELQPYDSSPVIFTKDRNSFLKWCLIFFIKDKITKCYSWSYQFLQGYHLWCAVRLLLLIHSVVVAIIAFISCTVAAVRNVLRGKKFNYHHYHCGMVMEGVRVSALGEYTQRCVTQSYITGEERGRKDVRGVALSVASRGK